MTDTTMQTIFLQRLGLFSNAVRKTNVTGVKKGSRWSCIQCIRRKRRIVTVIQ